MSLREKLQSQWMFYDVSIFVKATQTEIFANSKLQALEKLFAELNDNQLFTIELMSKEQLKFDITINEDATKKYKEKQGLITQFSGICDVDDLRIGRKNEEIEGEEK